MRHRIFVIVLVAFTSGIAFVVACGDSGIVVFDAGSDAAAQTCSQCERPITTDRVYYVRDKRVSISGIPSTIGAAAQCQPGDILLGGGCWIYSPEADHPYDVFGNRHRLIAAGPFPQAPRGSLPDQNDSYACVYDNEANDDESDLSVVATAICLDVQP
jgi:hypothetical protein